MAEQTTTKPFTSRRQQRWAFANKKKFAKRWANETPSFAALPEQKDAGMVAGAQLSGPGGLMATPGMGRRRWGRRLKIALKAQTASDRAMFAKMGKGGGSKGGGAKSPTLWEKNPKTGKRDPQMGLAHENLFGPSYRARQTEVKARGETRDRNRAQQKPERETFFRAQTSSVSAPKAPKITAATASAQTSAAHGLNKPERYRELEGATERTKMPQAGWNQSASDKQKGYLGSLVERGRLNTKEGGEARALADAIISANKSGKLTKWEASQLIDAMQKPKPFGSLLIAARGGVRDGNSESPWRALLAIPSFRTSLINFTLTQEATAEGLPF